MPRSGDVRIVKLTGEWTVRIDGELVGKIAPDGPSFWGGDGSLVFIPAPEFRGDPILGSRFGGWRNIRTAGAAVRKHFKRSEVQRARARRRVERKSLEENS